MAQEEEEMASIYEARHETIMSLSDGKQTARYARFLKPCVDTDHVGEAVKVPKTPLLSESFSYSSIEWPSKVLFSSRVKPQRKWEKWFEKLAGKYAATWYQSNICDSILSSRYEIRCNPALILGLAEYWCFETNTFVFPWGEATITLQDAMIIGGFPVIGEPVTSPLTGDFVKIEEAMNERRKELARNKAKKTTYSVWLKHFMEEEGELEHAAFLALWLSRYVFPSLLRETLKKEVFPLAIHLSRGKTLALAPAVLASLYRNLSLLKEKANASQESIIVSGPLQLVQLWAFEHFPLLGQSANALKPGEPRAARWHKQNPKISLPFIRSVLKLSENFRWRPYADNLPNWRHFSHYKQDKNLEFDSLSLDKELQSFKRCLFASELVGIDCREKYLPHRVAMQFGMDQDIPSDYHGMTSVNKNFRFFVPGRSCVPGVSERYFNWRKQSKFAHEYSVKEILKKDGSCSNTKVSPPLQENMNEINCNRCSNSSSSLEKLNHDSVISESHRNGDEGTGNNGVSKPAGAGKNEDDDGCLTNNTIKIAEQSQSSFHLDSYSKISRASMELNDDDDDNVPTTPMVKSCIITAKRTSSPKANTHKPSENIAPPKRERKLSFMCDSSSSSEIKKRMVLHDLSNYDGDDFPNSERIRSGVIPAKRTRGVSEVANGEAKAVNQELIDLENLTVIDDTRASPGTKNRKKITSGCSFEDPIDIDKYEDSEASTTKA